eukprot:3211819-Alexandrium_andersonii.AAC.1
MPHSGQQPAGRGIARQWSVQAAGPSSPPRPRALATRAAPLSATASHGRHLAHQAVPLQPLEG